MLYCKICSIDIEMIISRYLDKVSDSVFVQFDGWKTLDGSKQIPNKNYVICKIMVVTIISACGGKDI